MNDVDLSDARNYRGVSKELYPVVRVAAALGWRARKSGGGMVLLGPDMHTRVTVPPGRVDTKLPTTLMRKIMRATPQEDIEALEKQGVDAAEHGYARFKADLLNTEDDYLDVLAGVQPLMDAIDVSGGAFGVKPEQLVPEPAVSITDTHPWKARVGSSATKTDTYDSPAVIERVWSDGGKDYICAYCEESFVSDNPRSVSSHYAAAHAAKGQTPPSTQVPTEFNVPIDGPRTKRVAHLAREIEAALASTPWEGGDDWATFGRALATHIITARLAAGKEKVEDDNEPATPEDILARIKRLILRDEQDRVQRAETEAANLRAQIVEVEAERDTAKGYVRHYKETLATMASIAQEEST